MTTQVLTGLLLLVLPVAYNLLFTILGRSYTSTSTCWRICWISSVVYSPGRGGGAFHGEAVSTSTKRHVPSGAWKVVKQIMWRRLCRDGRLPRCGRVLPVTTHACTSPAMAGRSPTWADPHARCFGTTGSVPTGRRCWSWGGGAATTQRSRLPGDPVRPEEDPNLVLRRDGIDQPRCYRAAGTCHSGENRRSEATCWNYRA